MKNGSMTACTTSTCSCLFAISHQSVMKVSWKVAKLMQGENGITQRTLLTLEQISLNLKNLAVPSLLFFSFWSSERTSSVVLKVETGSETKNGINLVHG